MMIITFHECFPIFAAYLHIKSFVNVAGGLAGCISPLLSFFALLAVCFELQQLRLPGNHLVFEEAALHLHVFQQPLQLLHLLTPLLRLLLHTLQHLGLLA